MHVGMEKQEDGRKEEWGNNVVSKERVKERKKERKCMLKWENVKNNGEKGEEIMWCRRKKE